MKTKLSILLIAFFALNTFSQVNCRSGEANSEMYRLNPKAEKERVEFEKFTKNYVNQLEKSKAAKSTTAATYTIPVVFHLYGESQSGYILNADRIELALAKINEDFNGLNADFSTVDPFFQSRRGTISVEFKLAKKDPNGRATSGVVFHQYKSGYGDRSKDTEVAADAWDNTKYMNVYIQNQLYNDHGLYNSGVAWYPDATMTSANVARVVFNGAYLYNTAQTASEQEFSATLTHEFGHWLNLIHTFQDGCNATTPTTNDQVADTPSEDGSTTLTCSGGNNCAGERVNVENYMGYSGAGGCYKMFTTGQVNRMLAALTHSARFSLWQPANLIATGTSTTPSNLTVKYTGFTENLANQGAMSLDGTVASVPASTITLTGTTFGVANGTTLINGTHFNSSLPAGLTATIQVTTPTTATLTITGTATTHEKANSVVNPTVTFLNAAITGGVSTLNGTTGIGLSFAFKDYYRIVTGSPLTSYSNSTATTVNVNSGATWKYFIINPEVDDAEYGAWRYALNQLKIETYYKRLVCETGTRNISLIPGCTVISTANNFEVPTASPGQLDIYKTGWTSWGGQTGYVGFRVRLDGYRINGYFKVTVDVNGDGYTIVDYTYNTEPFGSITTPPCTLGLEEEQFNQSSINVAPNPFGDKITINTAKIKVTKIEIYNILGKQVYSENNNSSTDSITINTSALNTGIYLLKATSEDGKSITKKMIKN